MKSLQKQTEAQSTNIVTDVVVPSTPTPSTESPSAPQPVAKKRLLEPLPHEEPTRNGVKNARLEPPPEPPQQLIAQVLAAETNFANDVCVPPITQPSPLVTPVIPNAILPASQPIVTINVDSDEDVVEVTNTTSPPVIPSTTTPAIASIAPSKSAETTLEQEIRKKEGLDCVDDTGTFCLICETSVTSRSEMVTHLKGSKHVKKARSMGVIVRTTPFNASDTILRSLSVPARQTDWSLYRMPSGKFYCKTCNLIVTDEKLFGQHWYGKKHKLKLRQEQQADEEARTGTTVTGGGTATATESSFVLDDLEITPMAATNPTGSDKSVPGSSPGTAATSRKRKPFSKKWLYFYRKAKWAAVTK